MGDKSTARETMKNAGVPTVPGSDGLLQVSHFPPNRQKWFCTFLVNVVVLIVITEHRWSSQASRWARISCDDQGQWFPLWTICALFWLQPLPLHNWCRIDFSVFWNILFLISTPFVRINSRKCKTLWEICGNGFAETQISDLVLSTYKQSNETQDKL